MSCTRITWEGKLKVETFFTHPLLRKIQIQMPPNEKYHFLRLHQETDFYE